MRDRLGWALVFGTVSANIGVAVAIEACAGLNAADVAAVATDPRVGKDEDALQNCRAAGKQAELRAADGGSLVDAAPGVRAAGWSVYCDCTVEAGLRSTCLPLEGL